MIKITKLKNSLTVITDEMKDVKTVSTFISVNTGSRNESIENNGISHFLEHMLFKGTEKRTAFEIAREIDYIGGHMNADTSKEFTNYYIKVIDKYFEKSIEILSDMYQNSIFDEKELTTEKGVILQEIASSLDSSDDVAFDLFMEKHFEKNPLGRTILGPSDNIKKFNKEDFTNYMDNYYSTGNVILSVCGNVSHEKVLELADKYLIKTENSFNEKIKNTITTKTSFTSKVKKDLEQMQFITGFQAPNWQDIDNLYLAQVANNILGDGMSSRLFQEIREKRGLVYTVSSFYSAYLDNGIFGVYAGADINNFQELHKAVNGEFEKATNDIKDEEIEKCKNQFISSLVMSDESTNSRARKNASSFHKYNKIISNEEIIKKIELISKEQVMEFFQKTLLQPKTTVVYGNKEVEG